jgi:hypothetical protein
MLTFQIEHKVQQSLAADGPAAAARRQVHG